MGICTVSVAKLLLMNVISPDEESVIIRHLSYCNLTHFHLFIRWVWLFQSALLPPQLAQYGFDIPARSPAKIQNSHLRLHLQKRSAAKRFFHYKHLQKSKECGETIFSLTL